MKHSIPFKVTIELEQPDEAPSPNIEFLREGIQQVIVEWLETNDDSELEPVTYVDAKVTHDP